MEGGHKKERADVCSTLIARREIVRLVVDSPGVGPRQGMRTAPRLDGELLGPVTAVQFAEAIHGHTRRPSNKL